MADFASALWNKPTSGGGGGSTPADPVTRSLRFNDGDNSRLYFDPTATYDSETVYTFSCWAKLGELSNSSSQNIFSAGYYSSSSDQKFILFRILSGRTISVRLRNNSDNTSYSSTALLRDPSAWYHLLLVRNGASLKVYVNNTEVISETISSTQMYGIGSSYPMHIGVSLKPTSSGVSNYDSFDGLLADAYFIDGYAKSPTDFIESNDYGGYKPKAYTGSFGTNGFHIDAQPAHDAELLVSSVDRNDGDTQFADAAKGHLVSRYGNTHHDNTAGNPFGSGTAIYFDGSGDYLNIGTSSDFRTTTNNFTLDFWFKPNGSSLGSVFSNVNDGNVYDGLTVSVSSVSVSVSLRNSSSSNNVVSLTYTNDDTDWHHVEVSRTGSTLYLFVDGNLEDSGSISFTPTNSGLVARVGRIYANSYPSNNNYAGYLFDYRWSNSGGHTASFTAPTAPLELNPVYIGGDQSGNKNHFTPTNISGHDVMLDVPTKNYATINVLHPTGGVSAPVSEGNLKIYANTYSGGNYEKVPATIPIPASGKWYVEFYAYAAKGSGNISSVGVIRQQDGTWDSSSGTHYGLTTGNGFDGITPNIYSNNMTLRSDGVAVDTDSGGTLNDSAYICALAIDVDNGKIYGGYESGGAMTWMNSGDPTSGSTGTGAVSRTFSSDDLLAIEVVVSADNTNGSGFVMNAGQDPTFANNKPSGQDTSQSEFYYAPPTGFKSLNTSNLDDPTVTPEEHFNTVLYTGTRDNSAYIGSTSNAVTGMGFKPELLWIKDRDNASSNYGSGYYGNFLFDAVQGTGKAINTDGGMYTGSNDFSSNLDGYNGVSSFDSDGFTVDEAEAVNYAYDSDYNGSLDGYERYAAWGWKLGSNGSSSTWASGNTDPSTEKYNASAGVSVIRQEEISGNYPMTGVTVNHSLGAAPEFAFVKDTVGNTQNVYAWHKDLDANKYLRLNANSAQTTGSGYFPSGCSTATTFQIGGDIAGSNGYDGWWNIYMYLFTGVENCSKFGKYTGNGSSDGPMVHLSFRPKFFMYKQATGTTNWAIVDAERETYNTVDLGLFPNLSTYEQAGSSSNYKMDFLSNGVKIRTSASGTNANNQTFIYAAFAESPFKHANAR